jgi:hypothetical protein
LKLAHGGKLSSLNTGILRNGKNVFDIVLDSGCFIRPILFHDLDETGSHRKSCQWKETRRINRIVLLMLLIALKFFGKE